MRDKIVQVNFTCPECGNKKLAIRCLGWVYCDITEMNARTKGIEYSDSESALYVGDEYEKQPEPLFVCANCETPFLNSEGEEVFEEELYDTLKEKGMLHAE
jgi:hypothetical protein